MHRYRNPELTVVSTGVSRGVWVRTLQCTLPAKRATRSRHSYVLHIYRLNRHSEQEELITIFYIVFETSTIVTVPLLIFFFFSSSRPLEPYN